MTVRQAIRLVQRAQVAHAFGSILRTARHGAALSQAQLAIRAGLIRNHVGLIERGVKAPSLTTLINPAAGLGIKPEMLVALTVGRLRREAQL
jgi:XRE family transcriptional regulator, regulator of sulfur utilization